MTMYNVKGFVHSEEAPDNYHLLLQSPLALLSVFSSLFLTASLLLLSSAPYPAEAKMFFCERDLKEIPTQYQTADSQS